MLGGAVPLPPVLEPVGHLRRGESGGLRQLPLLPGTGIGVVFVPVPQHAPGLLFEAVAGLLAVPDGAGQGEFPPDTVLAHCAQRPTCAHKRRH